MPITKICLQCREKFDVKPSLARVEFCSRACLDAAKVDVVCLVCSNTFQASAAVAKFAKYCSDACRIHSGPVQKNCEACGNKFSVRSNRAGSARFCSQECQFGTMRKTVDCLSCLRPFTVPASSARIYCSFDCFCVALERQVTIDCGWCGCQFLAKESRSDQKFCSKSCADSGKSSYREFPEPSPVPGAKWIQLGKAQFALVDEADFCSVNASRWNEHRGYAYRQSWEDGLCIKYLMHRDLIGAPSGTEVDHVDGDRLNNRRQNLRLATTAQNAANRVQRPDSISGYRGVFPTRGGKWKSLITFHQKQLYIGTFEDPAMAALWYDDWARTYFGEFARLNFPKSGEQQA